MTTTTSRKPARTPHGLARLTLTINGTAYAVRPVPSPDGRAWSIRKPDGTRHAVAETPHGPTCDCGDFTWRRDGIDADGRKHIRAMRVVGLIAN
jgi:hypothetical protein